MPAEVLKTLCGFRDVAVTFRFVLIGTQLDEQSFIAA